MAESGKIHGYLAVAKSLVLECAGMFRDALALEKKFESKTIDCDLVTVYDKAIEKMLVEGLSKNFPNHKFVGEESASTDGALPELTDAPTWLIDPIDGTTNFVHGFSQCCISIGLAMRKRLVLGLIYNPTNNEMYTAVEGEGAFLNGTRIVTSEITELKKSLIYIEPALMRLPGKEHDIQVARLEALILAAQGARAIGSAALGLAYVARGTLDAFQMDHLGPWDVAAGTLIVTEAGGTVMDTKGGSFDVMKPRTIATSTKILAKEISKLMIDTDLQTEKKYLKMAR